MMDARRRGMNILCGLVGWSLINLITIAIFSFGYFSLQEKLYERQPINFRDSFKDSTTFHKLKSIESHCSSRLESAQFSKLTFIIIDALRADFFGSFHKNVLKESMPFLNYLMNSNHAKFFTSIAQTPTVTMPRIKALLAGIKPHYIDLLMNLNTARFTEDNLLNQAHRKSKRLVFYGDDTWLYMFSSDLFLRYNVTYSFFATDYIQVDTNVTDNLLLELKKLDEWDYLFLHYLGVDHIGHTFGPQSSLMPKKLKEMDSIIKLIFKELSKNDDRYLIVITGDHGMTDQGNHGGSTSQEFETGLIFIDTKMNDYDTRLAKPEKTSIKQIDIAVTLSLLLGLEIPKMSNGKLITSLIDWLSIDSDLKKCYLFQNSMQIAHIHSSKKLVNDYLEPAICDHFKIIKQNSNNQSSAKHFYSKYISKIQENIIVQKHTKNYISMLFQFFSIVIGVICALKLMIIDTDGNYSILLSANFKNPLVIFVLIMVLLRTLLLVSTSFIEMENYFWSYVSSTLVLLNLFRLLISSTNLNKCAHSFKSISTSNSIQIGAHIGLLLINRLCDSRNKPSFGEILISPTNWHLSTAIVIASLIAISFLIKLNDRFTRQQCIFISGLFWVYLYKYDLFYFFT